MTQRTASGQQADHLKHTYLPSAHFPCRAEINNVQQLPLQRWGKEKGHAENHAAVLTFCPRLRPEMLVEFPPFSEV